MAETVAGAAPPETEAGPSLKDQGNQVFKAGNYLKAAALYTQAIKKDPSNATLYRFYPLRFLLGIASISFGYATDVRSVDAFTLIFFCCGGLKLFLTHFCEDEFCLVITDNRSAAFLHLVKLNKALADAETTITLNPQWEKGYFRKGCVLEAMERYEDAIAAFQVALQHNPQSTEVSRKIKSLSQLARDKKRAQEVEIIRSKIDMEKYLDPVKLEMVSLQMAF
ncbi:hypothetical protein ACLOJK_033590 [Asimina triloba]